MSTDVFVGTWRPHRPRGPITALHSSPRPKYSLPTNTGYNQHDPCKYRAPSYSFGSRRFMLMEDSSSSPSYLVPPSYTMRGKDGSLAYSLYGRPKDLNIFRTPGPGTYSPEHAGKSAYRSAPNYSLGTRTKTFSMTKRQVQQRICHPAVLGPRIINKTSAPNFSMTGRNKYGSFHEDLQKTPGPGTYRVVEPTLYKYKPPQFSITARNALPGDTTQKPGPGSHSPEKVYVSRRQAPQYSFGVRHSDYTAPLIVEYEE